MGSNYKISNSHYNQNIQSHLNMSNLDKNQGTVTNQITIFIYKSNKNKFFILNYLLKN
jgi:hypothetical protein